MKLAKKLKADVKVNPLQSSDLLTPEEINSMIDVADTPRDKAIICTLAESGCRIGEITNCIIKFIQPLPKGGCKLILKGKTGPRTITLIKSSSYIDMWLRMHPYNNKPEDPLWITQDGKQYRGLSRGAIYSLVKRLAQKAGITKRIHPHIFRHTRATQLIKLGWSEPKVKKFLGWSEKSNVPSLYIHLGDDDLMEDVYEMHGLIEKKKDGDGFEIGKCSKC